MTARYEIVNRKEFFNALIAGESVDDWEIIYDDDTKDDAVDNLKSIVLGSFYPGTKLQRKQTMLTLSGISFPKPLKEIPVGTKYYGLGVATNRIYSCLRQSHESEKPLLDGFQITPEGAWKQARAIRKFLTGVDIGEYVPPTDHVQT